MNPETDSTFRNRGWLWVGTTSKGLCCFPRTTAELAAHLAVSKRTLFFRRTVCFAETGRVYIFLQHEGRRTLRSRDSEVILSLPCSERYEPQSTLRRPGHGRIRFRQPSLPSFTRDSDFFSSSWGTKLLVLDQSWKTRRSAVRAVGIRCEGGGDVGAANTKREARLDRSQP
jgi:hypothetical protein